MPKKTVHLFDDTNVPLKVTGIQIELYNSKTGSLEDRQFSTNLNPSLGRSSKEWGGQLTFTSGTNPLDLYITDVTYQYPGNAVKFLNGQSNDQIDLDLMKVPASALSNPPPSNSSPAIIVSAFKKEGNWTLYEKKGAINLLTNYIDLVYKETIDSPELNNDLQHVLQNWNEALEKLGVDGVELELRVREKLV